MTAEISGSLDNDGQNVLAPAYDDAVMESRYRSFLEESGIPMDYFKDVDVDTSDYSSSEAGYNTDEFNQLRKLVDSSFDDAENEFESESLDEVENRTKLQISERSYMKKELKEKKKKSKKTNESSPSEQSTFLRNGKEPSTSRRVESIKVYICRYKDCRKVLKTSKGLKSHHSTHSGEAAEYIGYARHSHFKFQTCHENLSVSSALCDQNHRDT